MLSCFSSRLTYQGFLMVLAMMVSFDTSASELEGIILSYCQESVLGYQVCKSNLVKFQEKNNRYPLSDDEMIIVFGCEKISVNEGLFGKNDMMFVCEE